MIQLVTFLCIFLLAFIDQLIKHFVVSNMQVGDICFQIPHFFDITYIRNYGGMMGSFDGSARLLSIVTVVVISVGLLAILLKKINLGLSYACIAAILAGGIGNLIDRIRLGYVIDYIEFLFVDFYVFNFADCLITVGAFCIIINELYLIIKDSKKKKEDTNNG